MQYLRAALVRERGGDIDSRSVELALARTEQGLQVACEQVEHSNSNNVVTLPAVKRDSTAKPNEPSTTGTTSGQQRKSMKEVVSIAGRKSPIKQARRQQQQQLQSLSPGQQAQAQHISHLVSQPTHPLTQQILATHYGLPLPSTAAAVGGGRKESTRLGQSQIITGPTTSHLTTLPRANRRDALVQMQCC